MPIENHINQEGNETERYIPSRFVNRIEWNENTCNITRERRKEFAQLVEKYNNMQKDFAKERDFESAKGMKELIKTVTQQSKCCTLVINYIENTNNLNKVDWPKDLAEFLDGEFRAIEISSW